MKTRVYIDGFNFYYGCIKNTAHKWLDFDAFCRAALPLDDVQLIRYFTARIRGTTVAENASATRQAIYLRALATFPNIHVHEGRYFNVEKRGMLLIPALNPPPLATIRAREEKGTDVNLATHLVADAFRGLMDKAVVITNDSDLVEPINVVRAELNLDVVVMSPHHLRKGKPSYHLQRAASSFFNVDRALLGKCQLPPRITEKSGRSIQKPGAW